MKHGHALLYTLISLMVLLWSGNYIVSKFVLREVPPLLLSGLRMTLAGALMLPVYLWDRRRTADTITRAELPVLFGLGLLGVALNQMFFVTGLSRTSVAHAAVINGTGPIQVMLLAGLRGQERITQRKTAGMLIALAGVVLLKAFEVRAAPGRGPTWWGDFFVFLGTLAFALFTVFGKASTRHHSSITVNAVAYFGAALAMAPITLWESAHFDFTRVTWVGWAGIGYMALFSSVVCYLIYYHALTHLPPSRASAFNYLLPPMATALGVVILSEPVTIALVVSGVVIFTGVWVTERG